MLTASKYKNKPKIGFQEELMAILLMLITLISKKAILKDKVTILLIEISR